MTDTKKQPGHFTHGVVKYRWRRGPNGCDLQRQTSMNPCWVTTSYFPPELMEEAAEALCELAQAEEEKEQWVRLYTFSDGARIEAARDGSCTRYWLAGSDRPPAGRLYSSAFLACYCAGLRTGREDALREQKEDNIKVLRDMFRSWAE